MKAELFEIKDTQGRANNLACRKLYTVGYGNEEEADFLGRLEQAGINFILDVRRKDAHSWNPKYRPGYSAGMHELLRTAKISYWPLLFFNPYFDLGNRFDKLSDYRDWISNGPKPQRFLENIAMFLAGNSGIIPCLLCAERSHEHCHRTIVAEVLVRMMNALAYTEHVRKWELEHI